MPLYEFYCQKCKKQFELLIRKQSEISGAACPDCGGLKITKVFSTFATVSGFKNDAGNTGGGLPRSGGGHSCHSCSSGNCSSCH
ncbi:MAG: zinc ribbon domain-containing protein [Planctomycetota bacterium]